MRHSRRLAGKSQYKKAKAKPAKAKPAKAKPKQSANSKRKSDKAKEKRLRRKQENARIIAALAKVEAANKQEDPLAVLPAFKTFDRNGLKLTISCSRVGDLDLQTVDWAFELLKTNMQTLYEETDWGWKDMDKREEMTEEKAWYLIARDEEQKPVAFIHFRFDMEQDDEVLYCYEIQLETEVRRKGLGKFLMQILELLAFKNGMVKVMLTVLKNNSDSLDFFTKGIKYTIDETNPLDPIFEEGYCYLIMSKAIPQKKTAAPP